MIKAFNSRVILRLLALSFVLSALLLLAMQWQAFLSAPELLPAGSSVAGVPVGGLSPADADARVQAYYAQPVTLMRGQSVILAQPADLGFHLQPPDLFAAASPGGFWAYLFNRERAPLNLPLDAIIDNAILRAYLETTFTIRYDHPARPPQPIPGSTRFTPGAPGERTNLDAAIPQIEAALRSLADRSVMLSIETDPVKPAPITSLQVLLQQQFDLSGFSGVGEVYAQNLATGETIDFARQNGAALTPGIAFTAASTIKLPIMVAAIRRAPEPVPQNILDLLDGMITRSENPPADTLMQTLIEPNLGPLIMTDDLRALGYHNTFMAGYFYDGAPLLQRITTPANSRTDVNLSPDAYNQTTPAEMGDLLSQVYACAEHNTGKLIEVSGGQMTQGKCQLILSTLERNRIAVLSEEGVPPGTRLAHKHGWTPDADGTLRTLSDVALVRSPAGDFVIAVYLHHPNQVIFDQVNALVAHLTETVYNYINPPAP